MGLLLLRLIFDLVRWEVILSEAKDPSAAAIFAVAAKAFQPPKLRPVAHIRPLLADVGKYLIAILQRCRVGGGTPGTVYLYFDGLAALGNGEPPLAASLPIASELLFRDGLAALGNGEPVSTAAVLPWLAAIDDGKPALVAASDA